MGVAQSNLVQISTFDKQFFSFQDITLPSNFTSNKFTIGLESPHVHVSIVEVLSPK